jgi:hypothetical protein
MIPGLPLYRARSVLRMAFVLFLSGWRLFLEFLVRNSCPLIYLSVVMLTRDLAVINVGTLAINISSLVRWMFYDLGIWSHQIWIILKIYTLFVHYLHDGQLLVSCLTMSSIPFSSMCHNVIQPTQSLAPSASFAVFCVRMDGVAVAICKFLKLKEAASGMSFASQGLCSCEAAETGEM